MVACPTVSCSHRESHAMVFDTLHDAADECDRRLCQCASACQPAARQELLAVTEACISRGAALVHELSGAYLIFSQPADRRMSTVTSTTPGVA